MKEFRDNWKKDLLMTIALLLAATLLASVLFVTSEMTTNIAIVYALFIALIARFTTGYVWGIFASLIAMFAINYFFSEPIMAFNFVKDGYPITFVALFAISAIISTITANLKETNRLLSESEKEKMRANLLRAISHDLRTPLTGIIGASRVCIENPDMDSKEQQKLLTDISEDASWLLNMVENLLSITRIETSNMTLNKGFEPLEEIVMDSVQKIKKRYPKVEIQLKLPKEIVMVRVDSMLIVQVIVNLLENAIKYSQSKEPIVLKLELCQQKVKVSVRDYGVGISPEKMKTLFTGTYVCRDEKADSKRGMGIGLSLCKTIIVAHGGEIEGKNHEKGAEICFWLPLEGEEDESEGVNFNY